MAMRNAVATLFACLLAGGLLGLGAAAQAATVYKWTDDKGVVHYGDAPPPGKASEAERLQLESTGTRPEPSRQDKAEKDKDEGPKATDVNITQAEIQVQKLEKQVNQARQVYEQARQNRMEGEKVRLGSEQNYVRYLERIDNLKQQEEAAKERLEDLRTQLEEARSRLEKLKEQQAQEE